MIDSVLTGHSNGIGETGDDFPRRVEANGDPIHPEDARTEDIVDGVAAELLPYADRGLMTNEFLVRSAARMAAEAVRKEIRD